MKKLNVLKNPSIVYLLSRYGTFLIQFINSMFVAAFLGPFYLGIWGFINLVNGYVSQINLGISHSVNVIISVNKNDQEYIRKIIGNGLSMVLGLSIGVFIFFAFIKAGLINLGNKYEFQSFVIPLAIISILSHVNALYSNIFRVYGKIYAIALNQSLYPVFVLVFIPFLKGEKLLWGMILANCAAFIVSFLIFVIQSPIRIKPLFNWAIIKDIQFKGWHLFVYNSSFYLIILTTNSFISGYYAVKEFGYYTFSYSLANVVLLLLNSISFLVFPKLLNRFANYENEQVKKILNEVREVYVSLSHLLIHLVIMIFPVLLIFFPEYAPSVSVFYFTALTVVLYSNSFGYQGLLMARGKEKLIATIAFCALILNFGIATLLVIVFKVPYYFVILATMFTYFFYVLIMGIYGRRILQEKSDFFSTLNDIFPWQLMVPFSISLILCFVNVPLLFYIIPFVTFLILNIKITFKIIQFVLKAMNNPNLFNI